MQEVTAYVALGSNLGDRAAHLDAAVSALAVVEGVRVLEVSSRFETRPVGGPPQGAFLNGALSLATTLAPEALLACLHAIESARGRTRGAERNTPRTLDLDLLFYGDAVIERGGLVVPHPRLHERAFVLEPLCQVASEFVHPALGVSVRELAQRVRDGSEAPPLASHPEAGARTWPS